MRIIAGSARRIPLTAPKGQYTRPTADRVKESLFNILAPNVADARFLDLFCGSGAIGIEALSRGASEAVFADSSKDAIAALTANFARAKLAGRIMPMCAITALSVLGKEGKAFDIVFMDPPYGQGLLSKALDAMAVSNILSPEGIVVAEMHIDEEEPGAGPLVLHDSRTYGQTRLMFYTTPVLIKPLKPEK